jgi:FtsZ-binding cell division protein ZapB
MPDHYLSEQHQKTIIAFIRRCSPKLVINQPAGGSEMDVDNLPHTTMSLSGDVDTQSKEIYETINILASESQCLNEDTQRLSSESIQSQASLDALTEESAKFKLSIREQNTYLDGLKPSQEILSQDVASLKQRIEDLQSVSYDGTLTWKITNVTEKMGEIFINKIFFFCITNTFIF